MAFLGLPINPPALIINSLPSGKYLLCLIINFNFFLELIILSGIISWGTFGGFIGICESGSFWVVSLFVCCKSINPLKFPFAEFVP